MGRARAMDTAGDTWLAGARSITATVMAVLGIQG